MSLVDRHVVARRDDVDHGFDVAEVDARRDTLRVQVQGEVDEVNIASALPVTKQTAFNSVCAREHAKLSSSDARPYDDTETLGGKG